MVATVRRRKYNHRYKLIYKLEKRAGGVTKKAVPDGYGACDAVLFCSMMYPPDGSFSVYFMGVDGRKDDPRSFENLEDIEWFKVWALLTSRLGNSKTLDEGRRQFCAQIFEKIRQVVWGGALATELEEKLGGNGPKQKPRG